MNLRKKRSAGKRAFPARKGLYQGDIDRISPEQYRELHRGDLMSFSIRLTDEERALAESYAKLHSISLSEAFKKALFEKIEDEYDLAIGREAYEEYIADQKTSRPISELWKECDGFYTKPD